MTLQVCHKKYQKQFTCTLVEWAAIIPGASSNPCQSAGLQERYIHEKLDLHIAVDSEEDR